MKEAFNKYLWNEQMDFSLFSQSKTDALHVRLEGQDQHPVEKGGDRPVVVTFAYSSKTF